MKSVRTGPGFSLAPVVLGFLLLISASCADRPAGITPQARELATGVSGVVSAATAGPAATTSVIADGPTATEDVQLSLGGSARADEIQATHIVREGDTLLGLAKQYGVPMAAIQLQNGMGSSTVVRVGLPLEIPSASGWEEADPFWTLHVVEEGDTLLGIAQLYDVEAERLRNVNGLAENDTIRVGEQLLLPLDGPAATRTPIPTDTPTPIPTATPTVTPTQTITMARTASATAQVLTTSPPPLPASTVSADIIDWPQETFWIINDVRADYSLPPLTYNETLAVAAQAHANDCASREWCSHVGSDGADIKTRILRAGYEPASWAECWAQRQTPQGAVDIWMDEEPPNDPHRRTLLTTWFTEIGIGVTETTWGYYFIADFGRPQ